MEYYQKIFSPILDHLDSETMHVQARKMLARMERTPGGLNLLERFNYGGKRFTDSRLNTWVAGVNFDNPVMVGAGWDKVGEAVRGLYTLGFSGVEVGTVLENQQDGNLKPRQFMVGKGVALNRLGFNSPGMDIVKQKLRKNSGSGIPIGISLGKNKDIPDNLAPQTHATIANNLHRYADYFAINVSSPNTPGLRKLQDKEPLSDIVQAVKDTMKHKRKKLPIFVKIAPDLTLQAVDDVMQVAVDQKIDGIIASNTTINGDLKREYGVYNEMGGLSGDNNVFRSMSLEQIRHIYRQAGDRLDIIGVGGVKDAQTAIDKIMFGAKLVQVVTGIRGVGPTIAGKINHGLVSFIEANGLNHIHDVLGELA